ncbi:MAG: zf-HC2 domain-containing protein [Gemmatimonadetes bacterium]|nr:zf-HC2 domain-containing protein [Gemmatimonadota bacterium]
MSRPDEGLLHAWLDGELEAEEAARVERLVAEDAEWSAAAAEARGLIAASSRILGKLDVVAGDVIPRGGSAAPAMRDARVPATQAAPRTSARRGVPGWLRVAAGVVLVAGIGYVVRDEAGSEADAVVMESGTQQEAVATSVAASAPDAAPTEALRNEPAPPAAPATAAASAVPARQESERREADTRTMDRLALEKRASEPDRTEASADVAPVAASATAKVAAQSSAQAVASPAGPPATVPAPAPAPASLAATASANAANEISARTRGVAGGVATGATRLDDVRVAGGTARPLLRDAAPARAPEAAALLGESAPAARLVGCWRVTSTLAMDPVQTDPRIVRTNGDTLWLALTPNGVQAEVVRSDDLLRGLARTTAGASAPITARLERCTP